MIFLPVRTYLGHRQMTKKMTIYGDVDNKSTVYRRREDSDTKRKQTSEHTGTDTIYYYDDTFII